MSQPAPAKHPSITALLKAYPGKTDPKEIIRDLAREKVAYAKARRWKGPPFCPKEFASIFGMRCKEVTHDIGGDGRILVQPNGKPLIEYAKGRMPERQRFTIFHEYAHTLFPDYCDYVAHHHTPEKSLPDPEREFELLCDVAAAEMLLPVKEFGRDLLRLAPACSESVHSLRKRYNASIDATIYRAVVLETRTPLAAVFLTDQKKRFSGDGPLWVNHSSRNSQFKPFIWPGTLPPKNSATIRCLLEGVDMSTNVRETWTVKGEPQTWFVQAMRLPEILEAPAYPKVVALLTM